MIRGEWKNIFSHRKTGLTLIVILFVPLLYSSIFLSAFRNPYSKTGDLPIAVVNEDLGSKFSGQNLQLGKDLVHDLKQNHSFKWKFTNSKEAFKGLKNEDFYMVVEIPNDFSKNGATLLDKHPSKMGLRYYTNPGKNYTASKIATSGISKINEKISNSITKQYAVTLFNSLNEVGEHLQKAAEGANKIDQAANKITNSSKTLQDHLQSLAAGTVLFKDGTQSLRNGTQQFQTEIGQLSNGVQTLNSGMDNLENGLGVLNKTGENLAKGSKQLEQGANDLKRNLQQAHQGTIEIQDKVDPLLIALGDINERQPEMISQLNSLQQILQGQNQLVKEQKRIILKSKSLSEEEKQQLLLNLDTFMSLSTADDLKQEITEFESTMLTVSQNSQQVQSQLDLFAKGQLSMYEGANKLAEGQHTLSSNLGTFNKMLAEAHSGANKLTDGTRAVSDSILKMDNASNQFTKGIEKLNSSANQFSEDSQKLADGSASIYKGSSHLSDGTGQLHSSLQSGATKANELKMNDKNYDMLSNPINLEPHKISEVNEYGAGLIPYILSIGLMASALIFSSSYQLKETPLEPTSGASWFLSKHSVVIVVSLIQSILAVTILIQGMGLEVKNAWGLYLFTILTSLTFLSLAQMLCTIFGKIGQIIGFILLLLQIGGSSGTFPIALAPPFYQHIHAFLPMTYAIKGFRDLISIGNDLHDVWSYALMLAVFGFVLNAGTYLFFVLQLRHKKSISAA
ncbi:YhgE/Pip domain-containing protein [Peribacillus simplex]|uniref:YhgE/Pip domain-containing protein n=1 Tax=Peribacillus simplex TaxID=1478 RepID=A0AAW7IL87_9BACI|nr:YhgE/Pip domain-containing protein [Peribacillus simplex]MDM5451002.1 YhgE/Pip domain-containing protein [Peribacillus simplex]